jgi:hypothetical protein
MAALHNFDWERFCQEAHRRIWAGEQRGEALAAAYVDCVYDGDKSDRTRALEACRPNSRRLSNANALVKARLKELANYSAQLAGIDAGWAQIKLKSMVEANIDDYLSPPDKDGYRYFDLSQVSREKLGQLTELAQDEITEAMGDDEGTRRTRKIKVRLPDKISALSLLAKIARWVEDAPTASASASANTVVMQVVTSVPRAPDEPMLDARAV